LWFEKRAGYGWFTMPGKVRCMPVEFETVEEALSFMSVEVKLAHGSWTEVEPDAGVGEIRSYVSKKFGLRWAVCALEERDNMVTDAFRQNMARIEREGNVRRGDDLT
jgi:hypothetical protein